MQNLQANSARPIKDGTAAMGKTHLKPLIAVIIQSAKLTESEQTKVCSEAHDLLAQIGAGKGNIR